MLTLTAALLAAALISVWFRTTRNWTVIAVSVLCLIHPWLTLIVLIVFGWAVHRFFVRKP